MKRLKINKELLVLKGANRIRLLLVLLFLTGGSLTKAQSKQEKFVYPSPSGNFVLLSLDKKGLESINRDQIKIERRRKGEQQFKQIGTFAPVSSYKEFEKLVSPESASAFKSQVKAKSNEDVPAILRNPKSVSDFGFFILDVQFLRAAGLVYLDEMPVQNTTQYEYRLIDGNQVVRQQEVLPFLKTDLPRGSTHELVTKDSMVRIAWTFAGQVQQIPLLGKLYRQENARGNYRESDQLITINAAENRLTAVYEERTQPERMTNYYIVAVDIFGNEGLPSDTISAISVDFKKIPGIQNLAITDTLEGLLSTWTPLPQKPYYTGIQILRSRDAVKDFIVLDTVALSAYSYIDRQVLPNTTYYYKFRPLVYKLSGWDEVIATTAHGTRKASANAPLAPRNLEASQDGQNIRLTWDPNSELDLFAYYVLRGTSEDNLEIVSPAIKDTTWLDSTSNLSGRTNYLYSVLAMSNGQLKSPLSQRAGIRPDRGEFVEPPTGISIRYTSQKAFLTWPDIRKKDAAVAGYILYRKESSQKEFTPVLRQLITNPYFEDATLEKNKQYTYVVTTVDRFGYESPQSPEAVFTPEETLQPPLDFYVRKLPAGVEISWPLQNNPAITTYTIYRRTASDGSFVKAGTVKSSEQSFIDKKFIPNGLNVYSITISTSAGESGKSIEKSIFIRK